MNNIEIGKIEEFFFQKKKKYLSKKWHGLLKYGMLGNLLFKKIVSDKRIARFTEFYLNLKKVDWELMPDKIHGKVLDVACHIPVDGYWISQIEDVDSVTLVDMAKPEGLPINKVTFVKSDATKLPFDDNTFDFVMSFSSIEHLTNRAGQEKWIKEMTRVVKTGGVVSITVDNATSVLNGFPLYWIIKNKYMMPLFWNTLEKMIFKSGNVIIRKKKSSGLYLYTSWIRPWSESLLSYWLERLLRPLNGKMPLIDARIGFQYIKK